MRLLFEMDTRKSLCMVENIWVLLGQPNIIDEQRIIVSVEEKVSSSKNPIDTLTFIQR